MQKKSIKNIHLYPVNNKFNTNLLQLEDEELNIKPILANQNIYKYFYTNNLFQQTIIFNSSIINNEIASFIQNFKHDMDIWIFIDSDFIIRESGIRYIASNTIDDINPKILPENIVNKRFYSNLTIPSKSNQLVYFFNTDAQNKLDKLQKYLYPSSNLKIKLFDSQKCNHPQNLGFLNESDRKNILCESEFYIHDDTRYYLHEALLCKCVPINLDSPESITDQMSRQKQKSTDKIDNIVYYCDFIKGLLNEQ